MTSPDGVVNIGGTFDSIGINFTLVNVQTS